MRDSWARYEQLIKETAKVARQKDRLTKRTEVLEACLHNMSSPRIPKDDNPNSAGTQ